MGYFSSIQDFERGKLTRSNGSEMFSGTTQFGFLDPENGFLKTERASLGRDMELWRVRSSGHEIRINEPSKISYLIPVAGRIDVSVADTEFSAATGDALLFPPNSRRTRVSASGTVPYEALAVLIPSDSMRATAMRAGLSLRNNAQVIPANRNPGAGLRFYTLFLHEELSRPTTPLSRPPAADGVAAIFEQFILELIMDDRDPADAGSMSAGILYVRRAEELMASRFEEAISVADVAEALGVGMRSLQLAFHKHRGYSPREALTRVRLEEVHKRLGGSGQGKNISHIAMDCGFTHMGRFAQAYRSVYGVPPSETARTL